MPFRERRLWSEVCVFTTGYGHVLCRFLLLLLLLLLLFLCCGKCNHQRRMRTTSTWTQKTWRPRSKQSRMEEVSLKLVSKGCVFCSDSGNNLLLDSWLVMYCLRFADVTSCSKGLWTQELPLRSLKHSDECFTEWTQWMTVVSNELICIWIVELQVNTFRYLCFMYYCLCTLPVKGFFCFFPRSSKLHLFDYTVKTNILKY